MIRDLIYAAKSTKDPKGSIGTQLEQCTEAVQALGREPHAEYKDEAASGWKADRGQGLANAMAEAERLAAEGHQVHLWVQHSDRLARGDGKQAKHLLHYGLWALAADVELHSLQDPQTFGDLLYTAVTGQRNNEDSTRKSNAVKDGHTRRRSQGGYHGGPEPYGLAYPRDEGGRTQPWLPLVRGEQAHVVELMAELILGGHTLAGVARVLNAQGIPTSRGKRWRSSTVRVIIRNPLYAGLRKDGTPMGHPALISPEDFQRIQALLASRARAGSDKGGRRPNAAALFVNGHLRCGRCGGPMGPHIKPNRRTVWRRYVCRTHEDLGADGCPQMPVPMELVERAVLEEFQTRAASLVRQAEATQHARGRDLAHVEELLAAAEHEHAKTEAALERLDRMLLDGQLEAANYERLLGKATADHEAAAAALVQRRSQAELVREQASPEHVRAAEEHVIRVGHLADAALRGEAPLEGVREALRLLWPVMVLEPTATGYRVLPQGSQPALVLDDELPGRLGEPILDRVAASSITDALGLTSAPVVEELSVPIIAPIYLEVP